MNAKSSPSAKLLEEPIDFSLVQGGPLFQLCRRARLCDDAFGLLRRRIVAGIALTWLPLLVLSLLDGKALGHAVRVPFLCDVDTHARFLLALPLLMVAELVVHKRLRNTVRQLLESPLVTGAGRPKIEAAIASALRWRNSVLAEVLLIALAYGVGVLAVWRHHAALEILTWYGEPVGGRLLVQPSLPGWWFGYVSLPLFQFLLLRWYYRLIIWARFLWQASRSELRLVPTHPDRAGGLGFLGTSSRAFQFLLMAQGTVVAGVFANAIFFAGAKLPQFKLEIAGVVLLLLLFVLGPLLAFVPCLVAAKRAGRREYGALAQRYALEFDRKWLRGGAPEGEALLGSADIQSLADMGGSYELVSRMQRVPFKRGTAIQLAVFTLVPMLPLTLTMFSLGELLDRVLKVMF